MIEKTYDEIGRILRIEKEDQKLDLYWNGDTPEASLIQAKDQEIYLTTTMKIKDKTYYSGVVLSMEEGMVLIETLQMMIDKLNEIENIVDKMNEIGCQSFTYMADQIKL